MGMPLNFGQEGGPGYTGPPPADYGAAKKQEPEPEPVVELTEEEQKQADIRAAGTALKEDGNALFKEKKFLEAIAKYEEAEKADPTLMTYRTNVASCYHGLKDYKKVLEECEKALDIGQENYNDFSLKAKAMERMANAHWCMGDFDAGIEHLNKAQMEIHDNKRYEKLRKWNKQLKKKKN